MKHKKRWLWLLLLPVLLIPVHVHMTDGGSEGWHAILWQLDHCHEFSDKGFLVGTRVSLLFGLIPVYDDTHEEPWEPEPTPTDAPAETRTDVPEQADAPAKTETDAARSCTVFYGGGETEVDGGTAEELYRICREAEAQGEPIREQVHEPVQQEIVLTFRSGLEGIPQEGPWYAVRKDDSCSTGASIYSSYAQDLQLPAGTYDALIEALTQDGVLPVDLGERVEGNEVYAVFEKAGLYTVQLYDREGGLVWAGGPYNKYPDVLWEEQDLWSVSLQAGTGLSTRWTVYYAPAEGRLSPYWYGVLDRQSDRLVHMAAYQQLEVCSLFESGPGVEISAGSFSQAPSSAPETFVSASFSEDGRSLTVTYLAGEDSHEVTETVPLP